MGAGGIKVSSQHLKLFFLFYAVFMNVHIPENHLLTWIWICTYLNLQIHQTRLRSCFFHVWILSFFALPVFLTAFPKPQPSLVVLCLHLKLTSLIRKAAQDPDVSTPGHKSRDPFEFADHAAADL